MNKILVEVSVGELLDKISILEIKKEKIKDTDKLKFINDELNILNDQFKKGVKTDDKLNQLFKSLKEINAKLWLIEDEKRMYEKNSDFGEKFVKVSRDIHFFNDDRAKIKLEINNHTGSKIKEIKEYTSY
tara:strand:- start:257 stop:646 length:390 start_codon:yes stop_codon:yes gene_type:complete